MMKFYYEIVKKLIVKKEVRDFLLIVGYGSEKFYIVYV